MDNSQWTMNCVIFGAELFKSLYEVRITKEEALAQIKNLSSEMDEPKAAYLLKRINELVA